MKHNLLSIAAFILLILIGMAPMVIGQESASDIPDNLLSLAKELNCNSKSACTAVFNANLSKGMNLAEKYNLYNQEQKKLASTFKDEVISKLSSIKEDEFEEKIIELAKSIINSKPKLAAQLGVDAPKIKAIETIMEEVKSVGADIDICSQPSEVLTRQQLIDCLNASRKLADKKDIVKAYISEKKLNEIGQVLNLQEAINRGEYKNLGKDADEIGAKCLQPGSSVMCDEIAKRFFGDEGAQMLLNARSQVKNTEDYYKKTIGNFNLVMPDGKIITGQDNIRDACDNAFQNRNIILAKTCGEFGVKNGFIKQEEFEEGLKFLQSVVEKGQEKVDFNMCRKDPRSCEQYMPDDMKQNFNTMADIEKIMVQAIGFDPRQCERGYLDQKIGEKCLEGSRRALPQLEQLAEKSVEARRIVEDIKMHINEGEQMNNKRGDVEQVFQSEGGPGGCKSPNECFKYCADSSHSLECLSFGAKQGFIPQEKIGQRFEEYTERISAPSAFIFPSPADDYGQSTNIAPGQSNYPNYPSYQPSPNFYNPPIKDGFNPDGSPVKTGSNFAPNNDCLKAIQIGDFTKAKEVCNIPTPQTPFYQPQSQTEQTDQYSPNRYYRPACSSATPSPCPSGQYRETQFVNGCAIYGACIIERQASRTCLEMPRCPVSQYHPSDESGCPIKDCVSITTKQSHLICPSMPTVDSCPSGQNKILTYSSPECGSYYTCGSGTEPIQPPVPPREGISFPYRFSDGYAAKTMDEAKSYCWANRKNNQSIADECKNKFGIIGDDLVSPPPTTEKWRSHLWYFKDGNSINSYILNREDSEYLNFIKKIDVQCQTISKERFAWLPDAGNDSNWQNFGIPDCSGQMSSSCPSGQYWNGEKCVSSGVGTYPGDANSCPGFAYSRWDSIGKRYCQLNNETRCDYNYPSYLANGANYTSANCPADAPNGSYPSCPTGQWWDMAAKSCKENPCPVGEYLEFSTNTCKSSNPYSSCASSQHWDEATKSCIESRPTCGTGQNWDEATKLCVNSQTTTTTTNTTSTTSTSCPTGQTWDTATNTCKTPIPTCTSSEYWDEQYKICRSIPTCSGSTYWNITTKSCEIRTTTTTTNTQTNTTTSTSCSSGQYWNGSMCVNSTTSTSCPSGQYWSGSMCVSSTTSTSCPAGQYWSGSACVSSTSTTGTATGSCTQDLINLLGTGCHNMSSAWFNTSMNQYVMPGTSVVKNCSTDWTSGCSSGSTISTSCPSGQYWNGVSCVATSSCGTGLYWDSVTQSCQSSTYTSNTGYCGDNVCQSYESATTCGSDCVNNASTGTTCGSGQYWNGSSCVSSTSTSCPSGQYWDTTTNTCRTTSSTDTTSSCPSGQYWSGSACVSSTGTPAYTDPSAGCTQTGGTWNTSTNSCQFPPTSFIAPLRYAITTTYNFFASALFSIFGLK